MSALSWTLSLRLLWFNREQHSWNYNWKFSSIIVMLYNYHFCTWSTPDQWHDGIYAFIVLKAFILHPTLVSVFFHWFINFCMYRVHIIMICIRDLVQWNAKCYNLQHHCLHMLVYLCSAGKSMWHRLQRRSMSMNSSVEQLLSQKSSRHRPTIAIVKRRLIHTLPSMLFDQAPSQSCWPSQCSPTVLSLLQLSILFYSVGRLLSRGV